MFLDVLVRQVNPCSCVCDKFSYRFAGLLFQKPTDKVLDNCQLRILGEYLVSLYYHLISLLAIHTIGTHPTNITGAKINPKIRLRLFSTCFTRVRSLSPCSYVELVLFHILSAYVTPWLSATTVAAHDIHASLPGCSRIDLFDGNIGIPPI